MMRIYPTADAYVRESKPQHNYGEHKTLMVQGDEEKFAFLTFDLDDIEKEDVIYSAVLRLFVTNASQDMHEVSVSKNAEWKESKITYRNRPKRESRPLAAFSPRKEEEWIEVDITTLVKSFRGKTVSVIISSDGSDAFAFRSKEASQDRPYVKLLLER